MKVKKLLELLSSANPEATVVLARDEEGNGYSPLSVVDTKNMVYQPKEGEVSFRKLTPKLAKEGYTEEDVCATGGQDCVVLWPTE